MSDDTQDQVKPFDLAYLLRHAFLSGRGLTGDQFLSDEDQAAWVAYVAGPDYIYDRVIAALERSRWQDISTAPKDGTDVLLWRTPTDDGDDGCRQIVAYWCSRHEDWIAGEQWCRVNKPTMWMPLTAPKEQ